MNEVISWVVFAGSWILAMLNTAARMSGGQRTRRPGRRQGRAQRGL